MKTPIQVKIIETVKSITPLKDEQIVDWYQSRAVVANLPIDTLDSVRSALKVALGDNYQEITVRYRGPRKPGKDTLKRDAVRYTIYHTIR